MIESVMSERVAKNLKQLLKERGITQLEFSYRSNYDLRTIQHMFKNGLKDIDKIQTFAKLLDVDITYFFKDV